MIQQWSIARTGCHAPVEPANAQVRCHPVFCRLSGNVWSAGGMNTPAWFHHSPADDAAYKHTYNPKVQATAPRSGSPEGQTGWGGMFGVVCCERRAADNADIRLSGIDGPGRSGQLATSTSILDKDGEHITEEVTTTTTTTTKITRKSTKQPGDEGNSS